MTGQGTTGLIIMQYLCVFEALIVINEDVIVLNEDYKFSI